MGLKDDVRRFEEIGEERRQDLQEFIKEGQLGQHIEVPIKIVDLPEFVYHPKDQGGVGQGDAEIGEPVDTGEEGDEGEGDDEAGEGGGEHEYYEMDPEEFARELDEELGLDLEPKGKKTKKKVEGAFADTALKGPESTLDVDYFFKEAIKRSLALQFDEEYMRELLKVDGMGPRKAFQWAREKNIPVSKQWFDQEYKEIPQSEKTQYDSVEDIEKELERNYRHIRSEDITLREEDKRYRYPEIVKEKQQNVVVVNIRDVSGSMREKKRDLVERVFTPMDWYLQGKYDNAEFVYIAHDADAWEVERDDFFGIRSGGGTKISSAYELAQHILEEKYPWSEWNRYVFAAGDGENYSNDSEDNVIPLMEDIDANKHAYVETRPSTGRPSTHGDIVNRELGERDDVVVTEVEDKDDIIPAIQDILSTEGDEQ